MENSEASKKIVKYLEKQPREVVNRLCANLMIDMSRWDRMELLPESEIACLIKRTALNAETLQRFLQNENEDNTPLTIGALHD